MNGEMSDTIVGINSLLPLVGETESLRNLTGLERQCVIECRFRRAASSALQGVQGGRERVCLPDTPSYVYIL